MDDSKDFRLQVITPDKVFCEMRADMLEFNTTEGEIGIYKNHIPLTVIIAPGIMKIHMNGEVKTSTLMAGFAQILPNGVTIMAEVAEWPEDIDIDRAKAAKIRAQNRLDGNKSNVDLDRAAAALKRALTRISVKN